MICNKEVVVLPVYEYECEKCKKRFELLQKMADPPLAECPDCKGRTHKIISSPSGLLFKGSGWYVTDYGRKNKSGADSKGNEAPSPSGGETAPKGNTKETAPAPTPKKD